MDRNYRIHTNIISDTLLEVNMQQDFDFLEVLSLKLRQKDAYRLHSSNYGVIVGRVLANDAFGIPNAKVSVFIEKDADDSSEMEAIYPYKEVTSKDKDGRRYNLLPDYSDDDCYRVVGTFPNKRLVLDDDTQLEIYDKYWKYTTVTNNAGDYMIFGVPTGSTQLHVDLDLSDIGVLSQKPRDFEYKGYNLTMFDSPSQFKESTNLESLAQIFSQNKSVFVYPFWGDADNGIASITRSDIQIQYKFEPTCVFMGSIVSDNEGHAIGHRCAPDIENGMNDQLIGGNGTIEMIRKTTDGLVEEYPIQGNQLIDENGVWCYQIPMNLDYIGTDEYGNIVPTDNPNTGIPTRAQVRFRISKNETSDEGFSRHTAKYLVPMNPIFSEDKEIPTIDDKGSDIEKMYNFGSTTPLHCFRDLYWNNVYSVKNYIPKVQVAHRAHSKNYGALKGANLADDQNPIPFNKLFIDLPFLYMIVCIIFKIIVYIVWFINYFIICTIDDILSIFHRIKNLRIPVIRVKPFTWLPVPGYIGCIVLSAGISEGNVAYYPGCRCDSGLDASDCPEEMEGNCQKSDDTEELMDKVQRNLALEFKIVKLDLHQDWVNGCLYMPLWYWRKRKKKSFLFGLITSSAKNEYCSDSRLYSRLKTYVTCNIEYRDNNLTADDSSMPNREDRWHKKRRGQVRYKRGLIKPIENKDGLTAYYYAALQATTDNSNEDLEMEKRGTGFTAVRLYATDIILLGNLDEKNIYGIPQFFKCLPSTTSNVPPIATIEEEDDLNSESNQKDKEHDSDTAMNPEDSGTTITTGMDWNHDGGDQTPTYKTGLFMDLECTYAGTRPKSCINVERMSELGVSMDMRYKTSYRGSGDDVEYGDIDSDGFITKYELDDTENRAMFATLNHIGFIPQEYQLINSRYHTQTYDHNTNYLIPKFKYIYPVDFDGRLQTPIDLYENGFEQALFDESDSSYITFRLGAESGGSKDDNSEGRIRHFYHTPNTDAYYSMPLYNNSYYFYFGIKKGSTAIDKFNKMFYAPCVRNDKKPFTLDIETRGRSYCPTEYTASTVCPSKEETVTYGLNENRNNAYGYIRISSDDIRAPYSYKLIDSYGTIIIYETGMTLSDFVIGGKLSDDKKVLSNCDGRILNQIPRKVNGEDVYDRIDASIEPYYSSGLTNQEYIIEITDSDGKTMSEKVKLDMPKISGNYSEIDLSAKFYNTAMTRVDYICHDENQFYGEIWVSGFTLDGYDCNITNVPSYSYDSSNNVYVVTLIGACPKISNDINAVLRLGVLDDNNGDSQTNKCLCDTSNPVALRQSPSSVPNMKIGQANLKVYYLGFENGILKFFVYQPNRYTLQLVQQCEGKEIFENSSSEIIEVKNATPFETYLNTMPTRFMIGTSNDNKEGEVAVRDSYFHSNNKVENTVDKHMRGWYGVHQETPYHYSPTTSAGEEVWKELVKNKIDDINSGVSKRTILKYKFDCVFSLSEGVYITEDSSRVLSYTSTGGVHPILYRSLVPLYNSGYDTMVSQYVLKDTKNVTIPEEQPNIVSCNYDSFSLWDEDEGDKLCDVEKDALPEFNPHWENETLLGNYFAAFTKNGGYSSKTGVDESVKYEKRPSFTLVNPNMFKRIGKDIKGSIDTFSEVYTKTDKPSLPYLRGMTVDRRMDYDWVLFAPTMETNFNLHLPVDGFENAIWKGARLSGTTYNGIEMSYDRNYNIIHATINNDGKSAVMTNILEYTYNYKDGVIEDSTYRYNVGTLDSVWEEDVTYDENGRVSSDSKPIIKRFYEATMNNSDIRNYFWSDFNKNRLSRASGIEDAKKIYIYKYPNDKDSLYNTDFNMDSVVNQHNYPSRRYIDISNIPKSSYFNITILGCSYAMKSMIVDDRYVDCEANDGGGVEFDAMFSRSITIVPPNADSNDYANVEYKTSGGGSKLVFSAKTADFTFKYNSFEIDGFNVYTRAPRVIQVLPYIEGTDGISYFKLCDDVNGELVKKNKLDGAINEVTKIDYGTEAFNSPIWSVFNNSDSTSVNFPESVGLWWFNKLYYKNWEEEALESTDPDFLNITFHAHIGENKFEDMKAFSILTERQIISDTDDYLRKHIRCFETSEIFDCRKIELEIKNGGYDGQRTGTYASAEKLDETPINGVTDVTANSSKVDVSGTPVTTVTDVTPVEGEVGSDTTKSFIQTVEFMMPFNTDPNLSIEDRNNEAFAELGMMSYTFTFKNSRNEEFDLKPKVNIKAQENKTELYFVIKWTANMGVLMDEQWGTNTYCRLTAKTSSNFVYRTDYFRFSSVTGTETKDMTPDGTPYPNTVTLSA